MIVGTVTHEDVPIIELTIAGQTWPAVINNGFNGDLELPDSLGPLLNARYLYRTRSLLGAALIIDEDTYGVDFPFDGQTHIAEATFVSGREILIGTHLL
jgi:hypothetical protein